MDLIQLISDVGFPIAGAIASGYFIFLTLKFILAGVNGAISGTNGMIKRLDRRVESMNTEVQRLDVKISHSLGLQPDYDRISRAEPSDQRID